MSGLRDRKVDIFCSSAEMFCADEQTNSFVFLVGPQKEREIKFSVMISISPEYFLNI